MANSIWIIYHKDIIFEIPMLTKGARQLTPYEYREPEIGFLKVIVFIYSHGPVTLLQ